MDRYIKEQDFIKEVAKIDLRRLSTKTIGEALDRTPTADVDEVVRCKDCKYWQERWHDNSINQIWGECHQARNEREHYYETEADGYCSYAERKEDGTTVCKQEKI